MAQQLINVGTSTNDGTGDGIRTAFIKTNNNFTELYNDVVNNNLTFTKLTDAPTYSSNQIIIASNDGTRLTSRNLVPGHNITITTTSDSQVVISTTSASTVYNDSTPQLSQHLNANGYTIGNLPDPSTLLSSFNTAWTGSLPNIKSFAVNVDYLNKRLGIDENGSIINSGTYGPLFLPLSGIASMAGNLNMNSHKITNLLDPTTNQDGTTKNYVDSNYLNLTGGTLTGSLNLGDGTTNNKISNVADPTSNQDVVTKNYLTSNYSPTTTLNNYLTLVGGTMTGVINMNSHKITNLLDPTTNQDAASKNYVDSSYNYTLSSYNGSSRTAITNAIQRSLLLKLDDIKSIKDFGVVGDGTTDDTISIQNAFNSGLNLYIPTGIYIISGSITISTTGQQIIGYPGAIIKKGGSTTSYDGLVISGNYIKLSFITINCNMKGFAGILIKGSYNSITNCEIYGSATLSGSTWSFAPYGASGINMDGQTSTSGTDLIGQTSTCAFNRIENNFIHEIANVGISANTAPDTIRTGNIIINCGSEGITDDFPSWRSIICDNYINNACMGTGTTGYGGVGGIGIDHASNASICNNVIIGTVGEPGITLQNEIGSTNFLSITSNTLVNNVGGILLRNNYIEFTGYITSGVLTITNIPSGVTFFKNLYLHLSAKTGDNITDGSNVFPVDVICYSENTDGTWVLYNRNQSSGYIASTFTFGNSTNVINFTTGGNSNFNTISDNSFQTNVIYTNNVYSSGFDIRIDNGCYNNTIGNNGQNAYIIDDNDGGMNTKTGIINSFRSYLSSNVSYTNITPAGDYTTLTPVIFNSTKFNINGLYNQSNNSWKNPYDTSLGLFTAYISGIYNFATAVRLTTTSSITDNTQRFILRIVQFRGTLSNTIQIAEINNNISVNVSNPIYDQFNHTISDTFRLKAGDSVGIYIEISSSNSDTWQIVGNENQTWFSGNLIG